MYTRPAATPLRTAPRLSRFTASLVGIMVVLLVACGDDSGTAAPPDGAAGDLVDGEDCAEPTGESLTVYSGRSQDLIGPVLDAFSCQSGVGINVRYGEGTELALLLEEEGDRTEADIFISRSPGPLAHLESNEQVEPLSDEVVDLVDPVFTGQDGTWIGLTGRKRVLVYNTEDVPEDELPDSVFELTDPEYDGRVAIPATNGSFIDWFTVFRSVEGDEAAAEWLDDMVDNGARFYPNNLAIVEAVGRGEIDLGLVNHYYNFQLKEQRGDSHHAENHDLSDDDIGSMLLVTAASVIAGSDNVEEGEALIEFMLADSTQQYFTEETFEYPLAADVEPNPELGSLETPTVGEVDFDELGGDLEATTRMIDESGILDS